MSGSHEITNILAEFNDGNRSAFDKLMPLVYQELHKLAEYYMRHEYKKNTLMQASALVNEAYIRLIDQSNANFQNRAHFFGIAARVMRQILVEYARKRKAEKRGGFWERVSLTNVMALPNQKDLNLIALDDALIELAKFDQLMSQIVELRFFGGLTIEEVAEILQIPVISVRRKWDMAKAWLYREISKNDYES